MIKIENTEVMGWEHAIRGMRNPLNSWEKSDSAWYCSDDDGCDSKCDECEMKEDNFCAGKGSYKLGPNDLNLMKRLCNAGTPDHRKFMRMIAVYVDIAAPLYWIAEHDTYKVGTVRNSCSFMHKGTSKPFEITDFSITDERVYDVLSPLSRIKTPLVYNYETSEYKVYKLDNGRKYKVFKNGRVFREEYDLMDINGRIRHFSECEVKPSLSTNGYYELNLGGRNGEKWLLHRLVAYCWIENKEALNTVNHINGNKGDNSVENLEWCSLDENIKKGFDNCLYDNVKGLHSRYIRWKNGHKVVDPLVKKEILEDYKNMTYKEIALKYDITENQANNICCQKQNEENGLFYLCLYYEKLIDALNVLRDEYIETKDENIFLTIRQLLPQGYNVRYTWMANYEVLANIYISRKNHRIPEWRNFCEWIKTLPYSELITGEFKEDINNDN